MTETLTRTAAPTPTGAVDDPSRRVDWRRLSTPLAAVALACSALAAIGTTLGTVVAGHLAEEPSRGLVGLLATCVIGASLIDTVGKVMWVGNSDRVEGRLREDLLDAALRQPLAALGEQAVGEILDRVDDDTHEVGNLVRWQLVDALAHPVRGGAAVARRGLHVVARVAAVPAARRGDLHGDPLAAR
ncbi:hypothetical protein [Nocardioides convexus]|uniref:hypothetical protein n=1 Tax=Nocardioides convexus TaxID=2712224 RepID=UPI0024181AE3|nr:hypothetical protein [Nocardioides convexus]